MVQAAETSPWSHHLVRPEDLPSVWREARALVERGIKYAHGELSIDDVYRLVQAGAFQMFIMRTASTIHLVGVAEFCKYPGYTALRLVAVGGRKQALNTWFRLFWGELRDWGAAHGAAKIEASCHPAMSRLLVKKGFYTPYTTVYFDLF